MAERLRFAAERGSIGTGAAGVEPKTPAAWATATRLGFLSGVVWFQALQSVLVGVYYYMGNL